MCSRSQPQPVRHRVSGAGHLPPARVERQHPPETGEKRLVFGKWAAIGVEKAARVFDDLGAELIPVLTPPGDVFMLARDEPIMREAPAPAAAARLLPSGDAYTLRATSEDRALLVPDAGQCRELWTPRVWPGALLVAGEVVGTWRRAQRTLMIQVWQRLSRTAREAVVAEAESLPLPDTGGRIVVHWS